MRESTRLHQQSSSTVFINKGQDVVFPTTSTGGVRKTVVTTQQASALGLGCTSLLVGLHIAAIDPNAGVTIHYQYSLDRQNWLAGTAAVITEKTGTGDWTGVITTAAELTPFIRVLVEVRDTVAGNPLEATVTTWSYYQYI